MHKETLLATLGCTPDDHRGVVNTPAYRASTILFSNLAEFESAERGEFPHPTYARYGTPSTEALEGALSQLMGADHTIVTPSGLAAIALAMTAFLRSGDHILMPDSVYGPARRLCEFELKRFGVETTYYDPNINAGIATLLKESTRVIYVESPGSLTFEMQDIPAIAKIAHAKNILVMGDMTWGTPLYAKAFELGMDIVIHSATKYIGGHSDLVMGTVSCKAAHFAPLLRTFRNTGPTPGGDNCFLALRGLRSMGARLRQHQASALTIARWLKARPEVDVVLHPGLEGAPGHDIWKRDFTGACGLFSIVLKDAVSNGALAAMLDGLELFGMGYSWGGYESLIIPFNAPKIRTVTKWPYKGQALRLHIGLEHTDDLISDLEAGFTRLRKAS